MPDDQSMDSAVPRPELSAPRVPPRIMPVEERTLHGIWLIIGSYLAFTGLDSCAKWLVLHGIPTTEVVFVRYFVHLVVVVALALAVQEKLWSTSNPATVVLRGLMLLGSTILNFTALQYLPLTMTSALMFTSPLWICLLSIPLLGERIGPRRWAALGVGFLGILVVARPWTGSLHWAIFFSLGAAVCGSFYAVLTRKLAGRESTTTQQFYAGLVATLGTAPFAFGDWTWPDQPAGWLALALLGVFGWGGHQLVTTAHRYAPASTLAPFVYLQIISMAASGWIIFAQPPDIWVLVGAAIVAASGLYIWLRERAVAARINGGGNA